jgi:hypothetical protein
MLLRIASMLRVTRRIEACPFSLLVILGGAIRLSRPSHGPSTTPSYGGRFYPVCRFSKAECAAYVPEKAKEGHKGRLRERHHGDLWTKRAKRDEARKLVLPGTWTFLGADLPINERWKFTPVPKRKAKLVPPVFKGCLVHFQRWKPDRHYYFGAWEQYRFVRWTRTPRPSMPICAIF